MSACMEPFPLALRGCKIHGYAAHICSALTIDEAIRKGNEFLFEKWPAKHGYYDHALLAQTEDMSECKKVCSVSE
jgi:hypothetical protein